MPVPDVQLLACLVQSSGGYSTLALVCYGIGIVFLLIVLRRTTMLKKRRVPRDNDMCLRARSMSAHAQIDSISIRQWLDKHHGAVKIPRDGTPLTPGQQRYITALAARQPSRFAAREETASGTEHAEDV